MINDVKQFGTKANYPTIGVLTHFVYDALLKDSLPTWDKFPLCLPIGPWQRTPSGMSFLGLNLHYVPQRTRKLILDQLLKHAVTYKRNPKLRIMVDYLFLKSASNFEDVKPCIKRYLRSHIESVFINIDPTYYNKIIKMPTAKWAGKRPY
jgi:hypothetical protein